MKRFAHHPLCARAFLIFAFISSVASSASSARATSPKDACFADAKKRALGLLKFYSDSDTRAAVGEPAEGVGIKSPQGSRKYRVIEVPGFIYKGNYRLRLIYASVEGDACVLMGEEILDLSVL